MVKKYETENLIIYWEPEKCQHSGKCVSGAPEVFNTDKRPWIMPEKASYEEIMKVIDNCPSQALSYKLK